MHPNLLSTERKRLMVSVATFALGLAGGPALAQTGAAGGPPAWSGFASITPIYQSDSDLDRGGKFGTSGAIVRIGASRRVGAATFASVTLNYDYFNYRFSDPIAFGGTAPWNNVQRVGFGVPITRALADGWAMTFAPSFDWFGERGAKSSESFTWGAVFSATKTYGDGRRLGLGFGAFDRFEETTVFPYLVIDWPLSTRLKLTNPAVAGPTGPAGLELRYRTDGGWDLGVGGAYRSTRFRLSESGPVPNGIGEERGVPLFVRLSRDLAPGASLSLYAGAIVAGSLRVEGSGGSALVREDFGAAPLVAATLSLRF
jgi:hypothetical protein